MPGGPQGPPTGRPDPRNQGIRSEAVPPGPPQAPSNRPTVAAPRSAGAAPGPPQAGPAQQTQLAPGPNAAGQPVRPASPQRDLRQAPDPTAAAPNPTGQPRQLGPLGPDGQAGWRERRDQSSRNRVRAREARWQNNRLAVPYPTDGPKITLGVFWFLLLVGAVLLGSYLNQGAIAAVAIAGVAAPVAGLAGLQTGNAWFPSIPATRGWTAVAAYLTGIAGFYGPWGVVVGIFVGVITLMFYVTLYRGHARTTAQLFDVLIRSAIPAGVAVASLAALGVVGIGVQISLILLVSAYEAGDFIVGSGSSNAVEGPMAGLVSLGAVTFLLFLILPAPFEASSILLFAALAGICCPLGQILASALLPRGNAWAPALRRLDSYLLAAPIWLLLAVQLPALS
ncbi:MAG: hypothetical protein AAGA65_16255 [Actinomycetota bacterium]